MAMAGAVLLLVCAAPVAAMGGLRGAAHEDPLAVSLMQPSVVSHLLSEVERAWEGQALATLEGQKDNATALAEVQRSCKKVTMSIIAGASGNKDRVTEYFKDVCDTDKDEHDLRVCGSFAQEVEKFMTDDDFHNREELDYTGFCTEFYNGAVLREAVEAKKEAARQEEAKRKAEAARKKKELEEAAVAHEAHTHVDVETAAKKVEDAVVREKKAKEIEAGMSTDDQGAHVSEAAAREEVQKADDKEVELAEAQAKEAAQKAEEKRKLVEAAEKKAKAEKEAAEAKAEAEKAEAAKKKAAEKAEAEKKKAELKEKEAKKEETKEGKKAENKNVEKKEEVKKVETKEEKVEAKTPEKKTALVSKSPKVAKKVAMNQMKAYDIVAEVLSP